MKWRKLSLEGCRTSEVWWPEFKEPEKIGVECKSQLKSPQSIELGMKNFVLSIPCLRYYFEIGDLLLLKTDNLLYKIRYLSCFKFVISITDQQNTLEDCLTAHFAPSQTGHHFEILTYPNLMVITFNWRYQNSRPISNDLKKFKIWT